MGTLTSLSLSSDAPLGRAARGAAGSEALLEAADLFADRFGVAEDCREREPLRVVHEEAARAGAVAPVLGRVAPTLARPPRQVGDVGERVGRESADSERRRRCLSNLHTRSRPRETALLYE